MRVKVQLAVFAPALLQAPDQMALRPLETVSLTEVPTLKAAEPVVPTFTLRPAGGEVTVSPVLPVAVSVEVGAMPQTLAVPPPPQVAPVAQVPQFKVPPQPSETLPQFLPRSAQVAGIDMVVVPALILRIPNLKGAPPVLCVHYG